MIEYIVAGLVAAVSAARLSRLISFDTFPPSAWLRAKWDAKTEGFTWNTLLHCVYCLPPWILAVIMATGLLSDLHPVWWVFNAWMALSYVSSYVLIYDGDD